MEKTYYLIAAKASETQKNACRAHDKRLNFICKRKKDVSDRIPARGIAAQECMPFPRAEIQSSGD